MNLICAGEPSISFERLVRSIDQSAAGYRKQTWCEENGEKRTSGAERARSLGNAFAGKSPGIDPAARSCEVAKGREVRRDFRLRSRFNSEFTSHPLRCRSIATFLANLGRFFKWMPMLCYFVLAYRYRGNDPVFEETLGDLKYTIITMIGQEYVRASYIARDIRLKRRCLRSLGVRGTNRSRHRNDPSCWRTARARSKPICSDK